MRNWTILRFVPGSVVGEVFGRGFSEDEAREYVDILDRRHQSTGVVFFAEEQDECRGR